VPSPDSGQPAPQRGSRAVVPRGSWLSARYTLPLAGASDAQAETVALSDGIALTDVPSDGITEAAGGAGEAGAVAVGAVALAAVPPPELELALEHPAASKATSTMEGAIARVKIVIVPPRP